jgi:8-oxo-dGTP pyrophosphatase MutT (NUDIX family)
LKIPSRVERVEILSRSKAGPDDPDSFLTLLRLRVTNKYDDGTQSSVYSYDGVTRKWIDAVVIALTSEIDGALAVCLRSCVRPPILLRSEMKIPFPGERAFHTLWELPAGLIEEHELGEQGIKKRAEQETLEETGYRISRDRFTIMPGAPFVSPGVVPERLYFLRAHIDDPSNRAASKGDGSPAEDGGGIWWVAVDEAIELSERGEIADLKTEAGLRRLAAGRRRP